jgi:hypothetical protein
MVGMIGGWNQALFYHVPLPEINDLKAESENVDPDGATFACREARCQL